VQVRRSTPKGGMTEQDLHHAQIRAALEQVRREGVPRSILILPMNSCSRSSTTGIIRSLGKR
jgi:hypothetical protein